jgi:MFS family permease
VCASILNVFALKYAVTHGIKTSTFLWCMIAAGIIGTMVQPLSGHVADKIGRRPVFMTGTVIAGLCLFPVFMAINTGNIALILLALTGVWGGMSMANGAGALYIEMFPTKVRYTGYAMGVTLAGVAAGFAPTIGASLMGREQSNWVPVALLGCVCTLIAVIGAYTAKETKGVQLHALGRRGDEVRLSPTTVPAERLQGD